MTLGSPNVGSWTLEAYIAHNEEMRQAQLLLSEERDRRYTEVNIEKEKALKIKETADLTALSLAREIQTYKDEKANELRSQIERERGTYATHADLVALGEKLEATVKPLTEYVTSARGSARGSELTMGKLYGALFAFGALLGIAEVLATVMGG